MAYDTKLTPEEEQQFLQWKAQFAPNDSGEDYDLRGAFKEGLVPDAKSGHFPDTYKKPNHPTFSNHSRYAKYAPARAGTWEGETYTPGKFRDKGYILGEDGKVVQPGFDENGKYVDQMVLDIKQQFENSDRDATDFNTQVTNIRKGLEATTGQDLKDMAPPDGDGINVVEMDIQRAFANTDPNIDQGGVKDFSLRAGVSRQDNPEEVQNYLSKQVGENGWMIDSFGNYAITPEGQKALGIDPIDRPILLDSPGLEAMDVADVMGDLPAIAGATAGAVATGGAGVLPAAAGAAFGGGVGSLIQEGTESAAGENLQGNMQIAKKVSDETVLSGAGEGIFGAIFQPAGRFALAPKAGRMTPEREGLMNEALKMGVRPRSAQVTDAPIATRITSMFDAILGDPNAQRNSDAIHAQAKNLRESFGYANESLSDIGELIKTDIKTARQRLSTEAKNIYTKVDSLIGGKPFIPTSELRSAALDIMNEYAVDKNGRRVLVNEGLARELQSIVDLPDAITAQQAAVMKATLRAAREDNTIVPGIQSYHAKRLSKAIDAALERVGGDPAAIQAQAESVANAITNSVKGMKDKKSINDSAVGKVADAPLHIQAPLVEALNKKLGLKLKPSDEAVNASRAARDLKKANEWYRDKISVFDNAFVQRLAKDPKFAGSLDPELVADAIFRKGRSSNINKVKAVLSPESMQRLRSAAMNELMDTLEMATESPFNRVFDGTGFVKNLDRYGKDTLEAMFGHEQVRQLYTFGNVVKLATKGKKNDGLVAAGVALHPISNFGKIVEVATFRWILNTPQALQWLTTGIKAPKTREGAKALMRLSTQALMHARQETQDKTQGAGNGSRSQ